LTQVFFDLTQQDFFDPTEKIEKFGFLRGNFSNPELADPIRPEQQKNDSTRVQKNLTGTFH